MKEIKDKQMNIRREKHAIGIAILFGILILSNASFAQLKGLDNGNITATGKDQHVHGANIISTGVPILLISPDAVAGSMGDVGVATTPDENSMHWNAAKLAFVEKKYGVSLTYTPWLREIVSDVSLSYLSGFYKINDRSAIGASMTYFSLGGITFYNDNGENMGDFKPNEFALDVAYSMKLSDNLSGSATIRYIRSDLTQGQSSSQTSSTHAANAFGTDIGLYYQRKIEDSRDNAEYALGVQISNLGSKISYSDDMEKEFQPANLRLGGRYSMDFGTFNRLSFMLDLNKLLVPTPPRYSSDSTNTIVAGKDDNVGILQGAIQSFFDAPDGFKEEMEEISVSAGVEWIYNKFLFLRGGYFYENKNKGDRQYITVGGGFKYNVMQLNVAYLIPTSSSNKIGRAHV